MRLRSVVGNQGTWNLTCRQLLIAAGLKRNWHKLAIDWSMDLINFAYAVDKHSHNVYDDKRMALAE